MKQITLLVQVGSSVKTTDFIPIFSIALQSYSPVTFRVCSGVSLMQRLELISLPHSLSIQVITRVVILLFDCTSLTSALLKWWGILTQNS